MENSKISWTTHTFNPWRGCTKVSPGCANCYAEKQSYRNPGVLGIWGDAGTRVVASEAMWREPLKWDRAAKEAGERHRVFCASLADVFEDWQGPISDAKNRTIWMHAATEGPLPEGITEERAIRAGHRPLTMDDVRFRLFNLIDATPNLDWLLLTKRPENAARMLGASSLTSRLPDSLTGGKGITVTVSEGVRDNVWIGTSVEAQEAADERIQHLLKIPAVVRFLSVEPLLGPVDLRPKAPDAYSILGRFYSTGTFDPTGMSTAPDRVLNCFPRIDWVIVGGESGPGARPCNVEWIRSLVMQCKAAGVACFVKQLGRRPNQDEKPAGWDRRTERMNPALVTALRAAHDGRYPLDLYDPKGGDLEEFPKDLKIREFPR